MNKLLLLTNLGTATATTTTAAPITYTFLRKELSEMSDKVDGLERDKNQAETAKQKAEEELEQKSLELNTAKQSNSYLGTRINKLESKVKDPYNYSEEELDIILRNIHNYNTSPNHLPTGTKCAGGIWTDSNSKRLVKGIYNCVFKAT